MKDQIKDTDEGLTSGSAKGDRTPKRAKSYKWVLPTVILIAIVALLIILL